MSFCMKKVLFLLVSGSDSPERASLGIITADHQLSSHRYEDVKVLLYGPSEKYVIQLDGMAKDSFDNLMKAGAIDSACVGVAKNYNISDELIKIGVQLQPFGERLAKFVNDDYEIITF